MESMILVAVVVLSGIGFFVVRKKKSAQIRLRMEKTVASSKSPTLSVYQKSLLSYRKVEPW